MIKTLELYEVANRFMVARTPNYHSFGNDLGLPPLSQASDDFDTVMQLDQCLVEWEDNLPGNLRLRTFQDAPGSQTSSATYRQCIVLRLRYSRPSPQLLTMQIKAGFSFRSH